jgi:TatD DNase family protein
LNGTLVDTHAHLDHERFDADRDAVIERAAAEGIARIVTIGTDPASCERALHLAEQYETVFAVVGLHPTDARLATPAVLDDIRSMANHPRVVGIGETGLDYYWKDSEPAVQQDVFREQIRLACDLDLPMVIHVRQAHEDMLCILEEEKRSRPTLRGVMHCFSGDADVLRRSLELDFHISFAGNVTYKKSALTELLPRIPLDRILIETDCPYLPPVPHRGQRNEPAFVRYTAAKVARILGMEESSLAELTSRNAASAFGLPQSL